MATVDLTTVKPAKTADARAMACPGPLLEAKKSIGTVNRIEPPQSEMKNALRMMTEGMEMIRVVVWKNALTADPMPVSHM